MDIAKPRICERCDRKCEVQRPIDGKNVCLGCLADIRSSKK